MMRRALEKVVGMGHRTVDMVFERRRERCVELAVFIRALKKLLTDYISDFRTFTDAGRKVGDHLKQFYQEPVTELTNVTVKYHTFYEGMFTEKIDVLEKQWQESVFAPIEEWLENWEKIKSDRIKLRNKAAYQYDHYFNKIKRLRGARDKAIKKKGGLPYKDQQRLERNEQKYEQAKAHFVGVNEEVGRELELLWRRRLRGVDPVVGQIVKMQSFFFTTYGKNMASIATEFKEAFEIQKGKYEEIEEKEQAEDASTVLAESKLDVELMREMARMNEGEGERKETPGEVEGNTSEEDTFTNPPSDAETGEVNPSGKAKPTRPIPVAPGDGDPFGSAEGAGEGAGEGEVGMIAPREGKKKRKGRRKRKKKKEEAFPDSFGDAFGDGGGEGEFGDFKPDFDQNDWGEAKPAVVVAKPARAASNFPPNVTALNPFDDWDASQFPRAGANNPFTILDRFYIST